MRSDGHPRDPFSFRWRGLLLEWTHPTDQGIHTGPAASRTHGEYMTGSLTIAPTRPPRQQSLTEAGALLDATLTGQTTPVWEDAATRVGSERSAVETHVTATNAPPVYGFNTLLGHMDGTASTDSSQTELLKQHLVGPEEMAAPLFRRLLVGAKLHQAAQGGSGISRPAYLALLRSFQREAPATGAWSASYGAGDVVPGAWLVSDLLQHDLGELKNGDLIALINGSWVGAAWGLAALASSLEGLAAVQAAVDTATEDMFLGGRQLPVSLRDAEPMQAAFLHAARSVSDAIGARLGNGSANPYFTFAPSVMDTAPVSSHSGNQFLDYVLPFALTNLVQAQLLALGVWQRCIQHWADGRQNGVHALVQPPKVAQAILEQARASAAAMPAQFVGSDSQGIEDLRDNTVATAMTSLHLGQYLKDMEHVWTSAGAPAPVCCGQLPELELTAFGDTGLVERLPDPWVTRERP